MVQAYPFSPYCGSPPHPGDLLNRWNLDPALLAALALTFAGYFMVLATRAAPARRCCFAAGFALAALALISPLCALSVSLFSARIGQHMLIETLAAPLIAAGLPGASGRGAVPAALTFGAALVFWHAPAPYVATFDSTAIYWAMHLTLFGAALWFWRETLGAAPRSAVAAVAGALAVSLVMALIGAAVVSAPWPLYAPHILTAWTWGLSPLTDQQLGGVIMWVPAGLIFVATVLAATAGVLRRGSGEAVPA